MTRCDPDGTPSLVQRLQYLSHIQAWEADLFDGSRAYFSMSHLPWNPIGLSGGRLAAVFGEITELTRQMLKH